jgi:hypothetical protein
MLGHELRAGRPTRAVSTRVDLDGPDDTLRLRAIEGRPQAVLVTVVPTLESHAATVASADLSGFGKRVLVEDSWDDFALSATVTLQLNAPDSHGDLIFRATSSLREARATTLA